jgi:hypothetical protein
VVQHVDLEPVHTESPGENIAYYKIASRWSSIDAVFLKADQMIDFCSNDVSQFRPL